MTNYIIEDNIDFWKNINDLSTDIDNDNECLLTGEKLTENFITLPCNHTFNYKPLANEFINQKQNNKFTYKLYNNNSSFCPYCKKCYDKILLHIPNTIDYNIGGTTMNEKNAFEHRECCYIFKTGKRKGEFCNSKYAFERENKKTFCYKHFNSEVKNDKIIEKKLFIKEKCPKLFKYTIKQLTEYANSKNIKITGSKNDIIYTIYKELDITDIDI